MKKMRAVVLWALIAGVNPVGAEEASRGHRALPDSSPPWAVRAHYDDFRQIQDLRREYDVWRIDHKTRTVYLGIYSQQEYLDLLATGVRAEVDQEQMDYLQNIDRSVRDARSIPGFACYATVEETHTRMDNLISANPNLARLVDIGDSWEKQTPGGLAGYDMRVIVISNQLIAGPKPVLYAMGSIHAREYPPAELVIRFAEHLLNNYGVDADATWLVDHHEIHLLPQGNPDGRKISETESFPNQRKNRNNNHCGSSDSRGVDMNRNFEFLWDQGSGSSGNPCSQTYRGPSAVSEPETAAINDYIDLIFADQRGPNLNDPAPDDTTGVYLDIHNVANVVGWPYGFSNSSPLAPNHTQLQTLGRRMTYFNGYTPGNIADLLGGADGASDDNAYGRLGVATYTIELGEGGFFSSCSSFESEIWPDNLPALMYAAKAARRPYIDPAGPVITDLATQALGSGVQITGTATDLLFNNSNGTEPTQNITAVSAYIDVPPWSPAALPVAFGATDGTFNSKSESFTGVLDTTALLPGVHTVYLRGTDASGVSGVPSAVFIEVTVSDVIYKHGFE